MNITESIKFNKLKEENEILKKELEKLKQKRLYKEDFDVANFCYGCLKNNFNKNNKCYICSGYKVIRLKDNSKYDKLPSKEDK